MFPLIERGSANVPVLSVGGGGGENSFGQAIFPFCSPPPLNQLLTLNYNVCTFFAYRLCQAGHFSVCQL